MIAQVLKSERVSEQISDVEREYLKYKMVEAYYYKFTQHILITSFEQHLVELITSNRVDNILQH